jgi:gamma-glutamylputrescine oxidase
MQQEPGVEAPFSLPEPPSYWQVTAPHVTFASQLPHGADVVVIGGGLLGASTCYWAARTGRSVMLLERTAPAAGATGRNGGFIAAGPDEAYAQAIARLGYETARAILDVTLESRTLLRQVLKEEAIACDYREPGHLHLTLEEEQVALFAESSLALQRDGVPAALLERGQLEDYIHTPVGSQVLGALFVPQMGLVHPVKLVQGLISAAQRMGARLIEATVLRLESDGEGVRLHTTQGTLHAGSAVVAANAWIAEVLPHLQEVITPVRGQVLTYRPFPSLFSTGITVDLAGSEVYWQQALDGTIVLGGCRSAAEGHDRGIKVSQPTVAVQHALEQVFPRLFPSLSGLHIAQRWAGLMAFTRDFLPIADQVPDLPHTWVVGGFSGHGMPYGLRFGQLLAEAATKHVTPAALQPFRRDRAMLQ